MSQPGEADWIGMVRPKLDAMHQARETALASSRKVIQTSAKCIRHLHRKQWSEAENLLAEAREMAAQARAVLADYPQLLHAGYIQDAEKELVEATVVLALFMGRPLPLPSEIEVEVTSYLNGLAEAASECRRTVLDTMRSGELDEANRLFAGMQAIYDDLITLDYPDALTGGLRRTCDALRAVLERTHADLVTTEMQTTLVNELRKSRG